MELGTVKITTKEYSALIRENEHMTVVLNNLTDLVISEYERKKAKGYTLGIDIEDLVALLKIQLPEEGEA